VKFIFKPCLFAFVAVEVRDLIRQVQADLDYAAEFSIHIIGRLVDQRLLSGLGD
jgi:hypothetical protein